MKTRSPRWFIALALPALATINAPLSPAFAQGTAFTFQGQLMESGVLANGLYDIRTSLYPSNGGDATVGGGNGNMADAYGSTVPGGVDNLASGLESFAAGLNAAATNDNCFVWSDGQVFDFGSSADFQFCIRAQGGIQADTSTSMFFGNLTRQMLNFSTSTYGIGVQNSREYFRTHASAGFAWFPGGSHSDTTDDPGSGGTELMQLTLSGLTVSGTFVSASDRNAKPGFQAVRPAEILDKVTALPISQWSYKADAGTRHIGPMAQDLFAAFNVGPDDKHIATVDEGGVALAPIQGLNQKLQEELKRRDAENMELRLRLQALERILLSRKSN